MPIARSLIATAAVSFGVIVSAGPAFAANSQVRKDSAAKAWAVKGAPSKHKKNPTQPS